MRTLTKLFLAFSISFLLHPDRCNAQGRTVETKMLVKQLSWKNISMNCQYILILTHRDSLERQLLSIGKFATPYLVEALDDPSKTVIAHIILTQLWDTANYHSLSTKYIYKNCNDLIGWHRSYNGIVWEWSGETGQTIRQSEIDAIKKYWTARVKNNSYSRLRTTEEILAELDKSDQAVYPCNKVYDNNSAGIRHEDLRNLIGKKSTDDDFAKLWTLFGNDSTISRFSDCYFINYGPEGLSFRFEDDRLSVIFIDDSYKGTLPYGLDFSFRRSVAIMKVGPASSADKFRAVFDDKGLFINFSDDNAIKEIALLKPR